MEKTIEQIKKEAETLKSNILQLIGDFEIKNSDIDVNVSVKHLCSFERDKDDATHKVDVDLKIK